SPTRRPSVTHPVRAAFSTLERPRPLRAILASLLGGSGHSSPLLSSLSSHPRLCFLPPSPPSFLPSFSDRSQHSLSTCVLVLLCSPALRRLAVHVVWAAGIVCVCVCVVGPQSTFPPFPRLPTR